MTLVDRIQAPRPKKILSLDGGGILRMMAIKGDIGDALHFLSVH
jgi:hypothetical protein